MFTRVFIAAILAGLVGGIVFAALQHFRTTPLIIAAEAFESGEGHSHGQPKEPPAHGEAGHNHNTDHKEAVVEQEWSPKDGFERTAYTVISNIAIAIGFAFLLAGVSLLSGVSITPRNGALWGLVAFTIFTLSPAGGLPPELPGMPAADLLDRQIWWTACVLAGVIGVALIALKGSMVFTLLAVVIIAAPHLVGAPVPTDHHTAVPAHMIQSFVVNSLFVMAATWIVVGAALGLSFKLSLIHI